MEAGGSGETSAGHQALRYQRTNFFDRVHAMTGITFRCDVQYRDHIACDATILSGDEKCTEGGVVDALGLEPRTR